MREPVLLALALLLALPPTLVRHANAQTVYRCTDGGGRVVLQQVPCPGGKRVDVQVNEISGPPPRAEPAARAASTSEAQEAAIAAGLQMGYPVVGMTMAQLEQVLGQPDRVNTSDYGRGVEEQRIYERGDRALYVYTANGRVRAVQNQAVARARGRACPSSTEMRSVEVSLSSVTIDDARRSRLEQELKEMREACRR